MSGFGARSFDTEQEANIQHVLTDDLRCPKSSSKGIDFQKQKYIHLANKLFKYNGWSYSVSKANIDFVEFCDNVHKVGVWASVKVLLKDGCLREDMGYGFYESMYKGNAIRNARKLACADALIETLKGLGNAFNYLSKDDFNVSEINSPSVQDDSSSDAQTDVEIPSRETVRPPVTRKRGRKRRGHLLQTSSRRGKIPALYMPGANIRPNESSTAQLSELGVEPYQAGDPLATNPLLDFEDPRTSRDVERRSCSLKLLQSTYAENESTSEAPTEAQESYKEVKRISFRGRRGRRRRGRVLSGNCRRRLPYVLQEHETKDVSLPPSPQTAVVSNHPTVSNIAAHCDVEKPFQSELCSDTVDVPHQRDDSLTSCSTNTADESPPEPPCVAVVSNDWRCETSAANSQTSNVKGVHSALQTDSFVGSGAVQLKEVNFAFKEELKPAHVLSDMTISPDCVQYSVINPAVCKAEALDLSSSTTVSHFNYHVKEYEDFENVLTKSDILHLF